MLGRKPIIDCHNSTATLVGENATQAIVVSRFPNTQAPP